MSSGVIDEQERAELEAAERGIRLTRLATYQRQTRRTKMTPEELAQEPEIFTQWHQQHEEEHQQTHQATVEYLLRKALGERVSQQQLADEYGVTVDTIRWRLRIYRGYDAEKYAAASRRREEEREAQIRESGMYAPVLRYDQFLDELDEKIQGLEALLPRTDAMEAYHQANALLCDIVMLFASQINREELTEALYKIIHIYGNIVSRVGQERPEFVDTSTRGFWELRYTPAQNHRDFMKLIKHRTRNMIAWLKEADIWQAYFHASNQLSHLLTLLISQLQDEAVTSRGKRVTSLFEAIAKRVTV